MTMALPSGWLELTDNEAPIIRCYQKTYADGLAVLLTIAQRNDGYELWSSAESRCAGPAENCDSQHHHLEAAIAAALAEMTAWDNN
ncbi:hypothetical protein L9G74_13235 [Shewanella sp. C32]|uniref:Uncharacterized protein n=1 Tax=Shewanella electrica TaxID=515560 RepID=A0ABT2FM40_9GAMM|nr:hypothetical protein [Shewanella electrica]MCH1925984.1 hypothetical protein [Shewanella electrica]MCS4557409.1 hypothetical protein [Shewanella electrica]